jgi:hypothetical protein
VSQLRSDHLAERRQRRFGQLGCVVGVDAFHFPGDRRNDGFYAVDR